MRVLVGLLGLVLGIVVGVGLVLANPLAWFDGLPPLSAEVAPAKPYQLDNYRGVGLGVADLLGAGQRDPDVAFASSALSQVRIGIVILPAGQGTPAALAVKVSTIAGENSLWRARLGTHDYWTVFWPGEGSVFAAGFSNFWGVVRNQVFSAFSGQDPQLIVDGFPISAPSPFRDSDGVTGAAGRYAGFTGEIRERLYPSANSGPSSTSGSPGWSLALKANPPPVTPR